jgi:hypothetical protein
MLLGGGASNAQGEGMGRGMGRDKAGEEGMGQEGKKRNVSTLQHKLLVVPQSMPILLKPLGTFLQYELSAQNMHLSNHLLDMQQITKSLP